MLPFVTAHVKWFVEMSPEKTDPLAYSLSEPLVLMWAGIILLGVIIAGLLDRFIPEPTSWLKKIAPWRERILWLFQALVGISLVLSASQGALLAPHYQGISSFWFLLQGVVGGLFIFNLWIPWASLGLIALYGAAIFTFGLKEALDYMNFFGIALFLLLRTGAWPAVASRRVWALPLLRVFTAIALIVLAFSEKLLHPSDTIKLLAEYPLNFMAQLGIDGFTDRIFTLCAGSTEVLFGLIFLFGFIPRINTLALAGFLISSNLYFFVSGFPEGGIMELTGHLPVLATGLIFLLEGAGQRFTFHRK